MPQNFAPSVIVHSRAQAAYVLSLGRPCTLLSARGAALAGGVGWWQAIIAQARVTWPNTACVDMLDCADAPGMAMAALRMAQQIVVLDIKTPAFAAVSATAARQGALVLSSPPPGLDMSRRGTCRLLAEHLGAQTQQLVTAADRDTPGMLR